MSDNDTKEYVSKYTYGREDSTKMNTNTTYEKVVTGIEGCCSIEGACRIKRGCRIKRNRLEISIKGLILAVVVIIACVLAAISLYMVQRGKSTINSGNNQYSSMMSNYTELDKTIYDGLEVSGDDVVNLIDTLATDSVVSVRVYTLLNPHSNDVGGPGGKLYSLEKYSYSAKSDADYINPSATFKGKVLRNENGIVIRIDFTQLG